MDCIVVLNRDSGTMKTIDPDAAAGTVRERMAAHGHTVEVRLLDSGSCSDGLDAAVEAAPEALIVGGGDGTVSSVAAKLAGRDTALGVIPLGTMNLFARTLRIPLGFEGAVEALATARVAWADLAHVNGRPFIHQVSLGLQPEMVRRREESSYRSSLGKKLANVRAFLGIAREPPRLDLTLTVDGRSRPVRATGLVVTNNRYGKNHLPFADDPADGQLGVYHSNAERWTDLMQLATDLVLGSWQDNPAIETDSGERVTIAARSGGRDATLSIDGELVTLAYPLEVTKTRRAIRVLLGAAENDA